MNAPRPFWSSAAPWATAASLGLLVAVLVSTPPAVRDPQRPAVAAPAPILPDAHELDAATLELVSA